MSQFWIVFGGGGLIGFALGWRAMLEVQRERRMMLDEERADLIYEQEVWHAKCRHPAFRGRVVGR